MPEQSCSYLKQYHECAPCTSALLVLLGGVEELEKQLRGEKPEKGGAVESPVQSTSTNSLRNRSLVERVLQGRNRHVNGAQPGAAVASPSGASATTPRYKSLFRNGPSRPQNDGLQDAAKDTGSQRERPKYVSIRRER